jgi:hypothetical protein
LLASNVSVLFFGILSIVNRKSYDLNVHLDLFIFSELEFLEGRNPRRRVVFNLSKKKAADLEQVSFCVFDCRKNLIFCRTYYGITFMSILFCQLVLITDYFQRLVCRVVKYIFCFFNSLFYYFS